MVLEALVDVDGVGLWSLVDVVVRQDLSHHAASLPQGPRAGVNSIGSSFVSDSLKPSTIISMKP